MSSESPYASMLDPLNLLQYWQKPFAFPTFSGNLVEPILPNGTFAGVVINENNTPNPQAERHILSRCSYGTQLEVIIDAVCALAAERNPKEEAQIDAAPLLRLQVLRDHIAELKKEAARARVEQIKGELGKLGEDELEECSDRIAKLLQNKAPARKRSR